MSLTATIRLGPYEIVGLLGAGGMGEVYRARDPRIGRDVAIKVVLANFASDPERLRRFEQEVRAVGALNHPNILTLYGIGNREAVRGLRAAGRGDAATTLLLRGSGQRLAGRMGRYKGTSWTFGGDQGISRHQSGNNVNRPLLLHRGSTQREPDRPSERMAALREE